MSAHLIHRPFARSADSHGMADLGRFSRLLLLPSNKQLMVIWEPCLASPSQASFISFGVGTVIVIIVALALISEFQVFKNCATLKHGTGWVDSWEHCLSWYQSLPCRKLVPDSPFDGINRPDTWLNFNSAVYWWRSVKSRVVPA